MKRCIEGELMSIYIYFFSESGGNGAPILGFTFQQMAARFARARVNKQSTVKIVCILFIWTFFVVIPVDLVMFWVGTRIWMIRTKCSTSGTLTYPPAVRALINSQKTCCLSSARCLIASRSSIRLASHPKSFCG